MVRSIRVVAPQDRPDLPSRVALWMDLAAGATGLAALILDFGFRDGARPTGVTAGSLRIMEAVVVAIFILGWLVGLLIARPRSGYISAHWGEAAMVALAAIVAGVGWRTQVPGVGPLYALSVQACLGVLVVRVLAKNLARAWAGCDPLLLLVGGLVFLGLAGGGLLMLPVATPEPTSPQAKDLFPPDALFTSVSAVTCTGLNVRDTGLQFTPFGQAVILVLVQIGGLGFMLLGAMLAMLAGTGLTIGPLPALGRIAGAEGHGRSGPLDGAASDNTPRGKLAVGRLGKFIVVSTLGIEAVGTAFLYPMFRGVPDVDGGTMSIGAAIWQSVFHSVSAFCNAGFSLYGRNLAAGVNEAGWTEPLRNHWQVMGVLAPLVVLGGVGLPVLGEGWEYVRWAAGRLRARFFSRSAGSSKRQAAEQPQSTTHSRVVLWATWALIFGGAAGLVAVEPRGRLAPSDSRHPIGAGGGSGRDGENWENMNTPHRLREALFQCVSARTGGFHTIDPAELSNAGKLWMCGLMIVGGSPAGTAGGMNTVTAFLVVLLVWNFLRRRDDREPFGGQVSQQLLRRAVVAAVLYLALVGAVTLGVAILMRPGYAMIDLFFESCSACGSVGLSTGITPSLNFGAKFVLIGGMLVGRLGIVTLLLAMGRQTARSRTADGGA